VRCEAVFLVVILRSKVLSSSSEQERKRNMEKVVVEQSRRIGGWSCGRMDRWYGEGEMLAERKIIEAK